MEAMLRWLGWALALTTLLGSPACGHARTRTQLLAEDLPSIMAYDPSLTSTRVLLDRRLVVGYSSHGERPDLRFVLQRSIHGAVIDVEQIGGAQRLWITFDPECLVPECSYAFVSTPQERFELARAPRVEGYDDPTLHRGRRGRRTRLRTSTSTSTGTGKRMAPARTKGGEGIGLDLRLYHHRPEFERKIEPRLPDDLRSLPD